MTYDEYIELVKDDLRTYGKEVGFGPDNKASWQDLAEAMRTISGSTYGSPTFDAAQSMKNIVPAMRDERYYDALEELDIAEIDGPEAVDFVLRLSVEVSVGTDELLDVLNGRD